MICIGSIVLRVDDLPRQRAFWEAALDYVPGAETIIPNLKRLMTYAGENRIPVLSSADAHQPDDPSFVRWPPHCVVGTTGVEFHPLLDTSRFAAVFDKGEHAAAIGTR